MTGPERKMWPVVVSGTEVVWVRGFQAPSRLRSQGDEAVLMREVRCKSTLAKGGRRGAVATWTHHTEMNASPRPEQLRTVIPTEQIQKRVREMARQISSDYQGKTIHALGLLENGFVFMADLVRVLEVPVICQFIKPRYGASRRTQPRAFSKSFSATNSPSWASMYLLIEGLVHSGVTSEFLMNDLRSRGAASVKLATLLDRQSARRVQLQPDYFGFSGGRSIPRRLRVGIAGADPSQPALRSCCKLNLVRDLSHGKNSILFCTRSVRMARVGNFLYPILAAGI